MAAPDELPIEPRSRVYPLQVTWYGGPNDSYVRIVDTFDGDTGRIWRQVIRRLEWISIAGTLSSS